MSSVSPYMTRDSVGRRVGVWQLCASPEALTLTNEVSTQQPSTRSLHCIAMYTLMYTVK